MASSADESQHHQQNNLTRFMQSASSNAPPPPPPTFALATAPSSSSSFQQPDENNSLSDTSTIKKTPSGSGSGFPSTVRISGLSSSQKGGGPAFVGQVFSMCDISGTGLMAVSTHIEIPFLSKRTPEWIKKMFAAVTKNDRNGPMFRFFMDLGDAVSYVKQLNIPTGVVGACRLDLAYEHFKEKPHMFQFVPNEKQVKAANKLLKAIPQNSGMRSIDGVPVFTAENLDIAIATSDGIKWYTPYFFDKRMLDNILEESVDQHFHSLIQTRRMQRRRDVIDDNLAAEVVEENGDSLWEPPEVQEVMDEMGHPTIPLSVISKVAEMQLHYAVDKVILGNRWLRKATGIQPKFPYMVDSFERRTAASFLKAAESTSAAANLETDCENHRHELEPDSTELKLKENAQGEQGQRRIYTDFRLPFGDWFSNPWSRQQEKTDNQTTSDTRTNSSRSEHIKEEVPPNPLLPRITMVGISTGETGQLSRSSLKKTMEDLTRKLEQTGQSSDNNNNIELRDEDRDPLFVANVGDYYSGLAKTGSSRWVRAGNN
ncbi:Tic22-like [Macleaya cordata]|uniref:Tic22-like n=1 Tax=Macleaya cordata TaxID=56857 RepID=A0A200R2J9_MACCD|nr:Tic22-like [Macleaya cordata]